jgi:hypothetical protein
LSFRPFGVFSVRLLPLSTNSTSFVLRGKQIVNLIENRCFVLSAICLVGNANCKIKQVVVNLGIAAGKIVVSQNFSYTEDLADLLTVN